MKHHLALTLLILLSCFFLSCNPTKECSDIERPALQAGNNGAVTICVLPTECREDTMAKRVSELLCQDSTGQCNRSCSNGKCVGVVNDSGLVVTAVTWDREQTCDSPIGTSKCTAKWVIPAGKTLQCGCACK